MRAWLLLALCCLCLGCSKGPVESGLAAKVNGVPISLRTLEFTHDLRHYGEGYAASLVPARLRTEYGELLTELIAGELVVQDLAKHGLEVDEAEILKAEMSIRASYPGRSFEDMLAEEGLDLDQWRARLKSKLSMDKFVARVLRPNITVDADEAQNYYKEHAKEFSQSAMVKFLKIESKESASLAKALEAARAADNPADMLTAFDDVSVQTLASAEEKLPGEWRLAISPLAPGKFSPVQPGGPGFQAFMLLERTGARVEGLVQAYGLVEKRLVEKKEEQAFAKWLSEALAKATIEVNPGLVPDKG